MELTIEDIAGRAGVDVAYVRRLVDLGALGPEGDGYREHATTCAFTGTAGESDFYNWSIEGENPAFPGAGIFDFDRADNPFADYSFI